MTVFYVAVLAHEGRRIAARIPDLPDISGAGATRAQALAQLIYYANAYVRSLLEHAEEVPPPRDIDDIPVEKGVAELGRALVPVEMPGKSVKISISIDEALLKHIDRAANAQGTTRSAYLAKAAATALSAKA